MIITLFVVYQTSSCFSPRHALNSIKKKLQGPNPYTAAYALLVLESMVKNCGHLVHDEVATREFMLELKDLVKNSKTEKVSSKILELLQVWATVFKSNPKYSVIQVSIIYIRHGIWSVLINIASSSNKSMNLIREIQEI